jgi:hypothetical protein
VSANQGHAVPAVGAGALAPIKAVPEPQRRTGGLPCGRRCAMMVLIRAILGRLAIAPLGVSGAHKRITASITKKKVRITKKKVSTVSTHVRFLMVFCARSM